MREDQLHFTRVLVLISTSRDLIQDQPDVSMKALAQDVGYEHVSNFTTAFKRKFGITPAAFAKTISDSAA